MTSTYVGDSGIVLCGDGNDVVDEAGVKWTASGEGPFSRSPAPREVSGERAQDHGSWDATAFYGPRSCNLTGKAYAPDHTSLHQAEQRLKAAAGLKCLIRHVEPGFDRQALFRRSGEVLWTEITDTIAQFSVPLWARDPLIYSTTEQSASTPFPSSSGGLTFPLTLPFAITATSVSGTLSLFNEGLGDDVYAKPTFRIDGPVVNPVIINDDTGQTMHLDLTIGGGEWVTIDTATGQVLGNGQAGAPRRAQWWGDWFYLRPGANNLRYSGDSAGPGAQLTATWRHAWI
jgi:hypothetical protein